MPPSQAALASRSSSSSEESPPLRSPLGHDPGSRPSASHIASAVSPGGSFGPGDGDEEQSSHGLGLGEDGAACLGRPMIFHCHSTDGCPTTGSDSTETACECP